MCYFLVQPQPLGGYDRALTPGGKLVGVTAEGCPATWRPECSPPPSCQVKGVGQAARPHCSPPLAERRAAPAQIAGAASIGICNGARG